MSLYVISEPYLCNVNQLKQTDMTTNERNGNITPQNEKTWNDDFMHQSLDEAAWPQLSGSQSSQGDSAQTVPWSTDFRNGGAGPLAGLDRREIRNGMPSGTNGKRSGGNPRIPHLQVLA